MAMKIHLAGLLLPILILAGCGKGKEARTVTPPMVTLETVHTAPFNDTVQAVGTAMANEQAILSAPVTQRVASVNFTDGAYVKKGQVLATLVRGQRFAQLDAANARAREAEQQLKRIQELRERGFATNSSLDSQIATASAADADAAAIREQIGDLVVRAPFGGWVGLRQISPGAVVTAGSEIATVSDISRIKLDFPVPETVLSKIADGQSIEAVAAAYPKSTFRGTIATIDPVVDPVTRSAQVRAILPNPDRRLRPGMLLTVRVLSQSRNSLAVPELAVVGDGDKRYVYTVGEDMKAKRTEVTVGARSEGVLEVLSGLKAGQKVVTEGVVKLADGMTVRTTPIAKAQSDGAKAKPASNAAGSQ